MVRLDLNDIQRNPHGTGSLSLTRPVSSLDKRLGQIFDESMRLVRAEAVFGHAGTLSEEKVRQYFSYIDEQHFLPQALRYLTGPLLRVEYLVRPNVPMMQALKLSVEHHNGRFDAVLYSERRRENIRIDMDGLHRK